jgi:hypothetical protein
VTKAIVIFLGVLFLGALPNTSFACSYFGIPRDVEFNTRAAVFIGQITAVRHIVNQTATAQGLVIGPGSIEVTFKVTRALKGEAKVNDSIVVRTSDQDSACGIETWAGETPGTLWIVYADRRGSILETGIYSRTKRTDSVGTAEELKYFDSLK